MDKMQKNTEIRARIAPSPTGPLHLGTARTALFNWLFSKHHGGKFILRIEDTDLERSDKKYEDNIVEGLKWLGIEWDEFYRQSERLEIYEKYLEKLLNERKAYYCYCSREELEEERQKQIKAGQSPKYSGKCREINPTDIKDKKAQLIRFKMPKTVVEFDDIIRGKISFDNSLTGDIAIAKPLDPNGFSPLYNFAVVIDDYEMKISHVIRGEDHIPNTPKQIALQEALGFATPYYAHLPLILNPDRSKLSKRYTETSLLSYREEGYLPEALTNFMALLGWHPSETPRKEAEDRGISRSEVLTREELIQNFELERVQRAGAIFNEEKLKWLNSEHIKRLSNVGLADLIFPLLKQEGIEADKILLQKAVAPEKERIKTLKDFVILAGFFFKLPEYESSLLIWKDSSPEAIKNNLAKTKKILELCGEDEFDKIKLETKMMSLAEKLGRGEVLWPLRAALSGSKASPGPFEIMEVLGKAETLKRIDSAIKKL